MKNTFLAQVIERIPKESNFFSQTIVLLPTKRAGIYFRDQLLASMPGEAIWLPTILSIEEFLYQHSPLTIMSDEDLLVSLHRIHLQLTQQKQSFAEFFKWGKMMLKDFNEIDQYLIDTQYLFHYVKEFKEIEADTILNEDQTALLNQFWDSLPRETSSQIRKNFLQTWASLGKIYEAFNSKLQDEGQAYAGQAYRALLKNLEEGEMRLEWSNFIIVGFNALSTFEERLFQHLCLEYKTKLYWDVNPIWMEDRQVEAGLFIRQYAQLFPEEANEFISAIVNGQENKGIPNVEVVETPMDTLQPEYAINLAKKWGHEQTAIVLCDESLVYPLSHLMDDEATNITMGFPASMSALTTFIKDAVDLRSYWLSINRLSPTILIKVLGFAGLRNYLSPEPLRELEDRIKRWGFINKKDVDELFGVDHPFFNKLLSETDSLKALIDAIRHMTDGQKIKPSDQMITEGLIRTQEEMQVWMHTHDLDLAPGDIWQVLKYRISTLKIPFEREGAEGLQVMGFLETRNLDFKNIIILSADEQHLPGTSKHSSFIPYSIKKGLQMPTYREHDAIYSYHFFRLLQRAENVSLVYSPQSNGMKQSRSRFVEQIIYKWEAENETGSLVSQKFLEVAVPQAEIQEPIRVDKTQPEVNVALGRYLTGEKQFSASSLTTYIHCPLQFYLKHLAELQEPELFSEDFDQGDLGRVFHRAMELFYEPAYEAGELLDRQRINNYLKSRNLKDIIQEAFEKENYATNTGDLKGQNLLVANTILQLMRLVLEKDMESEPFRVVGLELKFENIELRLGEGQVAKLKGFLDRVDEVHSVSEGQFIRIVDYKTGKADIASASNKSPEDYFRHYFENSKYKEGFQGYLYGWMYNHQHPGSRIKIAFYSAKSMRDGLKYLSSKKPVESDQFTIFEHYLTDLIENILDEEVPFIQSEKADAYKYSAYSVLVE